MDLGISHTVCYTFFSVCLADSMGVGLHRVVGTCQNHNIFPLPVISPEGPFLLVNLVLRSASEPGFVIWEVFNISAGYDNISTEPSNFVNQNERKSGVRL